MFCILAIYLLIKKIKNDLKYLMIIWGRYIFDHVITIYSYKILSYVLYFSKYICDTGKSKTI